MFQTCFRHLKLQQLCIKSQRKHTCRAEGAKEIYTMNFTTCMINHAVHGDRSLPLNAILSFIFSNNLRISLARYVLITYSQFPTHQNTQWSYLTTAHSQVSATPEKLKIKRHGAKTTFHFEGIENTDILCVKTKCKAPKTARILRVAFVDIWEYFGTYVIH